MDSGLKNPISILEELANANQIPRPEYSITSLPSGFKCEVKCGDVTVSGFGCNKKFAKIDGAFQALQKMPKLNSDTIPIKESGTQEQCPINAIGQLNEMCSQKGVPYPEYIFLGIKIKEGRACFGIECKCLKYSTVGWSSTNKKQAKQVAAMEMFAKLHPSDIVTNSSPHIDAKIMEVFKNLKLKSEDREMETDVPASLPVFMEEFKEEENNCSLELLRSELVSLGISYNVKVLQANPLILILKAEGPNNKQYTFLESEESYTACYVHILRSALESIRILTK